MATLTNTPGDDPVIKIRGLRTQFGAQVIHNDLDLDVRKGEVLGVVGGSGTGKSVLLRTIVGLNLPAAGSIELLGEDVLSLTPQAKDALRTRTGVLFQDGALFSALTVAENIQVPMREHTNLPPALMDQLAALKVSMVGLPPEAGGKYPSELSGGMRKRAGLARSMMLDPELLFCDEPSAGLDPITMADLDDLLLRLRNQLDITMVVVTHELDSIRNIADRIVMLDKGKVILYGTLDDLLKSTDPKIVGFVNGETEALTGADEAHQEFVRDLLM